MPIIEGSGLGTPVTSAGAPVTGSDEVQTLTLGGTPTGGSFSLAYEGLTSAAIPWNATNATLLAAIQTALNALPNLGTNGAVATAGTLTAGIGTVLLTFSGAPVAKRAVSTLTVADNSLTGTAPTLAIVKTTPGVNVTGRGAPKGALLIDVNAGTLYQNTGTASAPVWGTRT
jgi:hypothetical protein